jgi:Cu(I)/Ag(I) efflux system membrane protein CusA/SilA
MLSSAPRSMKNLTFPAESGPGMLRDENGMLNGYVYVDVAGRDVGSYTGEIPAPGTAMALGPPEG